MQFDKITSDHEILRDRIIFGVNDSKVRQGLLRESNLTLYKTDEICRASESMLAQMKVVSGEFTLPMFAEISKMVELSEQMCIE